MTGNTRNTLDLSVIPLVKSMTHLPVVVDPSHATGRRDLVLPMSLAALAAGADGLLVEVPAHPRQLSVTARSRSISTNSAASCPLQDGSCRHFGEMRPNGRSLSAR